MNKNADNSNVTVIKFCTWNVGRTLVLLEWCDRTPQFFGLPRQAGHIIASTSRANTTNSDWH